LWTSLSSGNRISQMDRKGQKGKEKGSAHSLP
jgi:hypothetical protein